MKHQISKMILSVVVLVFGLVLIPPAAPARDYQHAIDLTNIRFSWSIKGEKLYIQLVGASKGWVGIGFNPSYRMKDANFILGYVKNGKVSVSDAFGVRAVEHIDDTAMQGVSNISDVSGSEQGGTTTIEFAIPLDSGDAADGKLDKDSYSTVLLAYGRGRDNFQDRHRFRTRLKVNLSTGEYTR